MARPVRTTASGVDIQKMIEFRRQVERIPLSREPGDNSAMLLAQAGIDKGSTILCPSKRLVRGEPMLIIGRQCFDGRGELPYGFFDAVVGRRQLEPAIEELQMPAEFVAQDVKRNLVGVAIL